MVKHVFLSCLLGVDGDEHMKTCYTKNAFSPGWSHAEPTFFNFWGAKDASTLNEPKSNLLCLRTL